MKNYKFECNYCGHIWLQNFFMPITQDTEIKCPVCNDENIKAQKYEKTDYYGEK